MADEKIDVTEGSVYNAILDSDPEKASEMIAKADLVREILAIKDERDLTQSQLGKLIDMSQGDVSRMLKGNFRNIAIGKILKCLTSLNRNVRIVIERPSSQDQVGTMTAVVD